MNDVDLVEPDAGLSACVSALNPSEVITAAVSWLNVVSNRCSHCQSRLHPASPKAPHPP